MWEQDIAEADRQFSAFDEVGPTVTGPEVEAAYHPFCEVVVSGQRYVVAPISESLHRASNLEIT